MNLLRSGEKESQIEEMSIRRNLRRIINWDHNINKATETLKKKTMYLDIYIHKEKDII